MNWIWWKKLENFLGNKAKFDLKLNWRIEENWKNSKEKCWKFEKRCEEKFLKEFQRKQFATKKSKNKENETDSKQSIMVEFECINWKWNYSCHGHASNGNQTIGVGTFGR